MIKFQSPDLKKRVLIKGKVQFLLSFYGSIHGAFDRCQVTNLLLPPEIAAVAEKFTLANGYWFLRRIFARFFPQTKTYFTGQRRNWCY